MPETTQYACRWTDWVDRQDQHQTRVRYEVTGNGEEGLRAARAIARDTRAWQPHHGLPADATVVSRPIGEWAEVPNA